MARKRKLPAPNSLSRIAAHEAGHVVAEWCSRYCVSIDGVIAASEFGGSTLSTSRGSRSAECLFDEAVISLAGIAAENEMFGGSSMEGTEFDLLDCAANCRKLVRLRCWPRLLESLATDYQDIKRMRLTGFIKPKKPDAKTDEAITLALAHARGRVRQFWQRHKAVYRALMSRNGLNADDLRRILGPRPWAKRY